MPQHNQHNRDFIGQAPGRLIRVGNGVLFAFTSLVVMFAWLIDYHDNIQAEVLISSVQPPVPVRAEANQLIGDILVAGNQSVVLNQPIIRLHSEVDPTVVEQLLAITATDNPDWVQVQGMQQLPMAELRSPFQEFSQALNSFHQLQQATLLELKTSQLNAEIKSLRAQQSSLHSQFQVIEAKKAVDEKNLQRAEDNLARGLIAGRDLEQARSLYLTATISAEQTQMELIRTAQAIEQKTWQQQLLVTEQDVQLEDTRQRLNATTQKLREAIRVWEQQHIIRSPGQGQVSIPNHIRRNQPIDQGEELFTLIPDSSELSGLIQMPEHGAGKVTVGQPVNIRLNSFPEREYGKLTAEVKYITPSVHQNTVHLGLRINGYEAGNNLITTSHQRQIRYIPNMQGTAEIITQRKNLLQRIFQGLL
jgi:predicted transcriptional regulator